jgi:hypothetical protein
MILGIMNQPAVTKPLQNHHRDSNISLPCCDSTCEDLQFSFKSWLHLPFRTPLRGCRGPHPSDPYCAECRTMRYNLPLHLTSKLGWLLHCANSSPVPFYTLSLLLFGYTFKSSLCLSVGCINNPWYCWQHLFHCATNSDRQRVRVSKSKVVCRVSLYVYLCYVTFALQESQVSRRLFWFTLRRCHYLRFCNFQWKDDWSMLNWKEFEWERLWPDQGTCLERLRTNKKDLRTARVPAHLLLYIIIKPPRKEECS